MIEITAGTKMQGGCGHILNNGAPEGDVDQLHAFADAKNRSAVSDAKFQRLELENVEFGVDVSGTSAALAEEPGCDIAASGQYETGAGKDIFG